MSSGNKNSHSFTNNLIEESSPYLLQHAHNPVQWYAWNEKSLQLAKDKNKLILVFFTKSLARLKVILSLSVDSIMLIEGNDTIKREEDFYYLLI